MSSIKINVSNLEKIIICRMVHTRTGLYFNGYEDNFVKQKNTLSPSKSKNILFKKERNENEIFDRFFKGRVIRYKNEYCIKNIIVCKGSQIHSLLKEYYSEYDYLPVNDFHVEYIRKKTKL